MNSIWGMNSGMTKYHSKKCDVCGLYDAARKCLNCGHDICISETCVAAYVGGTVEDKVICINCA